MSQHDETRREIEATLRSMIPISARAPRSQAPASPNAAAAGLGGLLTGYAWGWLRGRRARKRS